ncbi:MAG TPA: hypothetical protein VMS73_07140 [Anaerolineaceae bacterium]|nr:hypothetical protein [Anaerolineaceae bacterium]
MKTTITNSSAAKWIVLGFLMIIICIISFMKSPNAITKTLEGLSSDVRSYSVFIHVLFLVVVGVGLVFRRGRDFLFSMFLALLSLSAMIISIKYLIAPNILMFTMIFGLILYAFLSKQIHFNFKNAAPIDLFFGFLGLVFGFWYLHWVESPLWLNAFLLSPLGTANCPTLLTICGFLCLSNEPRLALLEVAVGLMTLFFGFFGIFRLGAYVDIVLIICALYLVGRCGFTVFRMSHMVTKTDVS